MPSSARVLQLPFVFRGSSPSHQKGQELEQVRVEMGLRDCKDLSPKAFPRKDFLLVLPTFSLRKLQHKHIQFQEMAPHEIRSLPRNSRGQGWSI